MLNGTLTVSPAPTSPVEAPAWLEEALTAAAARRATDIHFFPGPDSAQMWLRIDGDLHEAAAYSPPTHDRLVARLKVMARITDYDGRAVQEGRFTLALPEGVLEARVSILPTLHGEKGVIRLIGNARMLRPLAELGFDPALIRALRDATDRPQGLLLATGPAGCGKSTALYALLSDLHERAATPLSILTLEDPIEQSLPFAAQIGIDPARGLDFPAGLRALLRQDPEVIMVGEIRDAATATTALQAALTGHRLLSSMHTLTAAEALVRLQQMGAPAYVIASGMRGILNVRLARMLCQACRGEREPSENESRALAAATSSVVERVYDPVGCDVCLGRGYSGRTAVGEWLTMGPHMAEALRRESSAEEVARTLSVTVDARPALTRLLSDGGIAPRELERLTGLVSSGTAREATA